MERADGRGCCRRRSSSRWPRNCCSASWSTAARSRSGQGQCPGVRDNPAPPKEPKAKGPKSKTPSRRSSPTPDRRWRMVTTIWSSGRLRRPAISLYAGPNEAGQGPLSRQFALRRLALLLVATSVPAALLLAPTPFHRCRSVRHRAATDPQINPDGRTIATTSGGPPTS